MKTAIIFGATGKIGQVLLKKCLESEYYSKITIVILKLSKYKITSLLDNKKINVIELLTYDELNQYESHFNANHVYCCIGSKNKDDISINFINANFNFPIKIALLTIYKPDFKCFNIISSIGANKNSNILYNQLKGKLEVELIQLKIKSLNIFRPGLILYGEKSNLFDTRRFLKILLSFIKVGITKQNKDFIYIKDFILSMIKMANREAPGINYFEPAQFQAIT